MTRFFAIAAVAVIAIALGIPLLLVAIGRDSPVNCTGSAVAGSTIGGPFELIDPGGRTVTDADVITEPSLVYFGYTFCPDVCPFDIARNIAAVELLAERGIAARPVFISVDPERDTPEVMGEYADAYYPDMVALTGSPEQVRRAADAYRVYYRLHDSEDEFYLVDHSAFTYLMMPETGFADFFRRDATAGEIAEVVTCLAGAG